MRDAGQGSGMRESAMQDADTASGAFPASLPPFPLPAFPPRIPHRVESPHSSLASPLTSVVHREGLSCTSRAPFSPLPTLRRRPPRRHDERGRGRWLVPGTLAGAWAYRHDAKPLGGVSMRMMFVMMLAGGFTGAMLLLYTPSRTFDRIIPWLLLFGSLVFTFGPRVNAWLRRVVHIGPRTVLVVQFLLGTYASYFGGAVGIMMLAAWGP